MSEEELEYVANHIPSFTGRTRGYSLGPEGQRVTTSSGQTKEIPPVSLSATLVRNRGRESTTKVLLEDLPENPGLPFPSRPLSKGDIVLIERADESFFMVSVNGDFNLVCLSPSDLFPEWKGGGRTPSPSMASPLTSPRPDSEKSSESPAAAAGRVVRDSGRPPAEPRQSALRGLDFRRATTPKRPVGSAPALQRGQAARPSGLRCRPAPRPRAGASEPAHRHQRLQKAAGQVSPSLILSCRIVVQVSSPTWRCPLACSGRALPDAAPRIERFISSRQQGPDLVQRAA